MMTKKTAKIVGFQAGSDYIAVAKQKDKKVEAFNIRSR
jgi:hypothetical protein